MAHDFSAIDASVRRGQKSLAMGHCISLFNDSTSPDLGTPIPADLQESFDANCDALVSHSAKQLKHLIERLDYKCVPEALDDLSANIFFPVSPGPRLDLGAATALMKDCFVALEQHLETAWPESVQTAFLRLFTFSLALISTSDLSSLTAFITESVNCQLVQ
jgi:hypothetical protein